MPLKRHTSTPATTEGISGTSPQADLDLASNAQGNDIDDVDTQLLSNTWVDDADEENEHSGSNALADVDAQEAEEVTDNLVPVPWLGWDPADLLSLAHEKFVWEMQINDDDDTNGESYRVGGAAPRNPKPSTSHKKGQAKTASQPKSVIITFDAYDLLCALQGSTSPSPSSATNLQQIPVPFKAKVKLVQPMEAADDVTELTASVNVGVRSDPPEGRESRREAAKRALGKKIFTQDFKAGLEDTVRENIGSPGQKIYKAMSFSAITRKELKEMGFSNSGTATKIKINRIQTSIRGEMADYFNRLFADLSDVELEARKKGLSASLCAVLNLDSNKIVSGDFLALFWQSVAGSGFNITTMILATLRFFGTNSEMRTRTIIDLMAMLLTLFCGAAGINCLVFPELILSAQEPRSKQKAPNPVVLNPDKAAIVVSETHAIAFTGRSDYHFFSNIDVDQLQQLEGLSNSGSTLMNAMQLLRSEGSGVVVLEVKGRIVDIITMLPQVSGQALASMFVLQREYQPYILTNGEQWIFGCIAGDPRHVVERTNRFFKISLKERQSPNENVRRWDSAAMRCETEKVFSIVVFWSTQEGQTLYQKIDEWAE